MQEFLTENLVSALGWTLLHSIWQASLGAFVLAILLVLMRRQSSVVRYYTAVIVLFTVLGMSIFTFWNLYEPHVTAFELVPEMVYLETENNNLNNVNNLNNLTHFIPVQDGYLATFTAYFNEHLPLIVLLWFLGITVLSLKFAGGWIYTQRLKHYKTYSVPEDWKEKVHELSFKLGLGRSVKLLESSAVKVPMVIGWLKPVILVPIGTFTGLEMSQVESILAHELAHVRRDDYLVNLLQSTVEILFFYHPAIWWISAYVREERENCCDDIAVAVCGDSLTYAKALTSLEDITYQVPQMAMALSGRGKLFHRIERLLNQSHKNPTFAEGFTTAFIVLAGLLAISNPTDAQKDNMNSEVLAKHIISENNPIKPTEKLSAQYMSFQDSTGKKRDLIIIKNSDGDIEELYVDGQKIAKKDIPKFQEMIEKSMEKVAENQTEIVFEEEHKIAVKEMLDNLEENSKNTKGKIIFGDTILTIKEYKKLSKDERTKLRGRMDKNPKNVRWVFGDDFDHKSFHISPNLSYKIQNLDSLIESINIDSITQASEKYFVYEVDINEDEFDEITKRIDKKIKRIQVQASKIEDAEKRGNSSDAEIRKLEQELRQTEQELRQEEVNLRRQEARIRHIEHKVHQAEIERETKIEAKKKRVVLVKEVEKAHKEKEVKLQKLEKKLGKSLKKDGLTDNAESFTLKFQRERLFVNDKEQPKKIFDKYAKMYQKEMGQEVRSDETLIIRVGEKSRIHLRID